MYALACGPEVIPNTVRWVVYMLPFQGEFVVMYNYVSRHVVSGGVYAVLSGRMLFIHILLLITPFTKYVNCSETKWSKESRTRSVSCYVGSFISLRCIQNEPGRQIHAPRHLQ